MFQDIDAALSGWEFKPGVVQSRMVQGKDGRQVIQLRVDLGILQLETNGRPDGHRPHNHDTYFAWLQQQAKLAKRAAQSFTLSEEQCEEADREFVQYYHRRICWLALRCHVRAIADADHTLAFMDFVRDHSPGEDYTRAHEQYRGFVLFHRTQAASSLAIEENDPEAAIDEIQTGLNKMQAFFAAFGVEEHMEEDGMVQQLRKMEEALRRQHHIKMTLREKLDKAVANEEYETAAKLRDELKRKR